MKLRRLKVWLIHKLGGVTNMELKVALAKKGVMTRALAFATLKEVMEVNYGKDWRDDIYKLACAMTEFYPLKEKEEK